MTSTISSDDNHNSFLGNGDAAAYSNHTINTYIIDNTIRSQDNKGDVAVLM